MVYVGIACITGEELCNASPPQAGSRSQSRHCWFDAATSTGRNATALSGPDSRSKVSHWTRRLRAATRRRLRGHSRNASDEVPKRHQTPALTKGNSRKSRVQGPRLRRIAPAPPSQSIRADGAQRSGDDRKCHQADQLPPPASPNRAKLASSQEPFRRYSARRHQNGEDTHSRFHPLTLGRTRVRSTRATNDCRRHNTDFHRSVHTDCGTDVKRQDFCGRICFGTRSRRGRKGMIRTYTGRENPKLGRSRLLAQQRQSPGLRKNSKIRCQPSVSTKCCACS